MTPQNQSLTTLEIIALKSRSQLSRFNCGVREIDRWAEKSAYKDHSRDRRRVFVLQEQDGVSPIGFYSLSLRQEHSSKLLTADEKFTWQVGAPFLYVDYIAVQRSFQGQSLGKLMLTNAMRQAILMCEIAPVCGLALKVLNAELEGFYEKRGFKVAPNEEKEIHKLMVLPLRTIRELIG